MQCNPGQKEYRNTAGRISPLGSAVLAGDSKCLELGFGYFHFVIFCPHRGRVILSVELVPTT